MVIKLIRQTAEKNTYLKKKILTMFSLLKNELKEQCEDGCSAKQSSCRLVSSDATGHLYIVYCRASDLTVDYCWAKFKMLVDTRKSITMFVL